MQLFPFQVDSFPWLKENFGVSSLLLYFVTRIKFQPAVGSQGCASLQRGEDQGPPSLWCSLSKQCCGAPGQAVGAVCSSTTSRASFPPVWVWC